MTRNWHRDMLVVAAGSGSASCGCVFVSYSILRDLNPSLVIRVSQARRDVNSQRNNVLRRGRRCLGAWENSLRRPDTPINCAGKIRRGTWRRDPPTHVHCGGGDSYHSVGLYFFGVRFHRIVEEGAFHSVQRVPTFFDIPWFCVHFLMCHHLHHERHQE